MWFSPSKISGIYTEKTKKYPKFLVRFWRKKIMGKNTHWLIDIILFNKKIRETSFKGQFTHRVSEPESKNLS